MTTLKPCTALKITGEPYRITVLLATGSTFPYDSTNIAFVTVEARSLGEAGRIARESYQYNPITDIRPVVISYYL